ncbi:tripartite tricarboxylate transporter substrate binding protein [Paramaledivibacter caminithermalis]|jgi:tripartite-type tricarboxylate transporter receptor subunit TctC|uniref:Tripartite-type tricarboxylate transporter, receptor component TctC n=1 Tax=Paramaledivibacter caminithermalis (strain DSM 15212 / CIP 107654 / DViRD3) TaxID=1121301 RepID=A0A1M6K2C7_PARC5|nr:tripartite tricarboxylate transporter substrate binding protein [Paramaledivibacter caminithermalis]SHJ53139.1 Tripartite-type tricarboxylate transporter, receptor component TctC [Paramaledivibacter caminithermalis DSM 15212]
MKKLIVVILSLFLALNFVACSSKQESETGRDANQETSPADKFPEKPIEVIVAYKAGGGTDRGARVLTAAAQKTIEQPLVIINKPGADGELGFTELVNAKPDGYTIGFINLPTFVSLPLSRNTKYTKDDVEPLMNYVYDAGVLVVKADSQWKTLEEFIDYAKKNPEKITISNNGTGASNHIGAAHLAYEADIKVTHVPFGGSKDMLAALRGDHVNATVAKISEVANLVKNGELRLLASYTEERLVDFPKVPTLKEKGYDIQFGSARALAAPKGVPNEILEKLHNMLKETIELPEHMEAAKNSNLQIKYMSPEELRTFMDKQEAYLKEITTKLDLD